MFQLMVIISLGGYDAQFSYFWNKNKNSGHLFFDWSNYVLLMIFFFLQKKLAEILPAFEIYLN